MAQSQYEKDVDAEGVPALPEHIFATLPPDEKLNAIYRETVALKRYVHELESRAQAMTSPDGMANMMKAFMGNMGM
jgi:hypothetical protein